MWLCNKISNILFMGHTKVPCALILIQRIQKETNLIGQYILTILTAELSMTTCSMSSCNKCFLLSRLLCVWRCWDCDVYSVERMIELKLFWFPIYFTVWKIREHLSKELLILATFLKNIKLLYCSFCIYIYI